MKEALKVIIGGIGMIAFFIAQFGGVALHLFTILTAFEVDGFIGALLALIMPFFAQCWWFFKSWANYGSAFNPYGSWVLAYLGLWACLWVGMGIFALLFND